MSIFSENKPHQSHEFNPLHASNSSHKKLFNWRIVLSLIVIGLSVAYLFNYIYWMSKQPTSSIPFVLHKPNTIIGIKDHQKKANMIVDLIKDISEPELKALESYQKALKNPSISQDQASQLIDFTIKRWPHLDQSYLYAAQYYIQQQDFKKALSVMSYQPPSVDGHTEYYGTLAYIHLQMHAYSQAEQIYLSLSQIDENNPLWWLGLATIYDITQQYKLAEHAWQKTENYADHSAPYYGLITQRLKHRDIV